MPQSVRELFDELPRHFDPAAWGATDAVLQFNITGPEEGTWRAEVLNGSLTMKEGAADKPDLTVTCDSRDLLAIVNGELNAVSAFMQGRLKIDGNMSLAMKLQGLLG